MDEEGEKPTSASDRGRGVPSRCLLAVGRGHCRQRAWTAFERREVQFSVHLQLRSPHRSRPSAERQGDWERQRFGFLASECRV